MNRLDSDLLRTFLAIMDAGSVTGGAAKIHRSQSAASVQIKQLEELLNGPVFKRHGRGVTLSPAGEVLAPVARQVVQMLDTTLAEMNGSGLEGSLCIGIPDDRSKDVLSEIVAEFGREHPKVELTVRCALSTEFPKALVTGGLDLAVHEVERVGPDMELLREDKLFWVDSRVHHTRKRDPLPVALFDQACWWRDVAHRALQASGRNYRVVYSSESVTGVAAAIEAGIAIGVLGASVLNDKVFALSGSEGFGEMPSSKLVLEYGRDANDTLCKAMAKAIRRAFTSVQ